MIKPIKKLKTIYMGDLILDDDIRLKVKDFWVDFSKDKDPNEFYDGDIYCVIDIDDVEPSIRFKKTKYSYLVYANKTKEIIVRSLFSAGYIRTADDYVCIILNNRNKLNSIGGMAANQDIINNSFDYEGCIVREIKEELGIDISNDSKFEMNLRFFKYPNKDELLEAFYPVGTLYEIKTLYTREELIDILNNNKHDKEIKELKFYNKSNFNELYSYDNKVDYLDELFRILFE